MVVSSWPGWPRFFGKLDQFLAPASPRRPGRCYKLYCRPNFKFSANTCKFLARLDLPVLTLASHGLSRPCRPFVFSLFLSSFGPGQPHWGQARLALWPQLLPVFFIPWPTRPKPGHKPGSPQLSGQVWPWPTPLWPGSLASIIWSLAVIICP